jgi:hypothetical protein
MQLLRAVRMIWRPFYIERLRDTRRTRRFQAGPHSTTRVMTVFFRLGNGSCEFLTHWSKAGDTSIYCYSDSTNLVLAVAPMGTELSAISDASLLDFTSRVRTPRIGQIVVFENHASRYAAARIAKIEDDTRGASRDWLEFDFWILESGGDDFSQNA